MIVTWGPGGGADQTGRMIGKLLEPELKVSLPVENIAGSCRRHRSQQAAQWQPEGYQLGLITADTLSLLAAPRAQRWSLDRPRHRGGADQAAVRLLRAGGRPFKTWADVEAKAKTTELKVGVTGLGTPDELAIEQMKKHRGLKLVAVPFAKPGERYASVIGGHADLVYEQAGDIRSFIDNKQMTPVLFLANEKVHPFKDITITKELGMNLVLDQYRTLMAKAGTPPERLKLLRRRRPRSAASKEFKTFLEEAWADPNSVIVGDAATAYIAEQIQVAQIDLAIGRPDGHAPGSRWPLLDLARRVGPFVMVLGAGHLAVDGRQRLRHHHRDSAAPAPTCGRRSFSSS